MKNILQKLYDRVSLYSATPDTDPITLQWQQNTTTLVFLNVLLFLVYASGGWLLVLYLHSINQSNFTSYLLGYGVLPTVMLLLGIALYFSLAYVRRHKVFVVLLVIDLVIIVTNTFLSGPSTGFLYFIFPILGLPVLFLFTKSRWLITIELFNFMLVIVVAFVMSSGLKPYLPLSAGMSYAIMLLCANFNALSIIATMSMIGMNKSFRKRIFQWWEKYSHLNLSMHLKAAEKKRQILINRLLLLLLTSLYVAVPLFIVGVGCIIFSLGDLSVLGAGIASSLAILGTIPFLLPLAYLRFYKPELVFTHEKLWLLALSSVSSIYTTFQAIGLPREVLGVIMLPIILLSAWIIWGRIEIHFVYLLVLICAEIVFIFYYHSNWQPLYPAYPKNFMLPLQTFYLSLLVIGIIFLFYYVKHEADVSEEALEAEYQKSERLLLNILPRQVAHELRDNGSTKPVRFESATVLFTDFVGFTKIAENFAAEEVVDELDKCFSYFDQVTEKYHLEKLKTIGDAFMCAAGLPAVNYTHAIDSCLAALEIQAFMNQMKAIKEQQGHPYWQLRLGINTGPLVAGVVGTKKFAYDVWGDTVNTASRMESSGSAGKINISRATYNEIKFLFQCEYRGKVQAKNKGEIDMFYLHGIKAKFSINNEERVPNDRFKDIYKKIQAGAKLVARKV